MTAVRADELATAWRLGLEAGEANPAGPLFAHGRYAPSEITADWQITPNCPTLQWTPCNSWCLECTIAPIEQ